MIFLQNMLPVKNKKAARVFFIFFAAFFVECASVFSQAAFSVSQSEIPKDAAWQRSLQFPDWEGDINESLAPNGICEFDFFSGQGELYVEVGRSVESFSIFVNQERVDTASMRAGRSYKIDFSKIARDGKNFFQAACVLSKRNGDGIKAFIPYPVLLDASTEESGIDKDCLALISEIIQSDIEHGFTSAQLALAKNGRMVYKNSWGYLNSYDMDANPIPLEQRKKVTNDTLFDLASCTKALAANCALEYLITQKKLSLDTKIADVLGDDFFKKTINIKYKRGSGASLAQNKKWKAALTIRDLASHMAGFPAGPAYYNINFNSTTQGREKENQIPKNKLYAGCGADAETRQKTYEAICKTPLLYEPGKRVLYSDADYIILCFVIEKITGERLDDFCKKTFWLPMGLERIAFNPLENGFSKDDCAATELRGNTRGGTLLDFKGREETIQGQVHDEMAWYSMAGISGHAGLFANASDAAKLLFALSCGGYGQNSFFSKDVIDSFFAPGGEDRTHWGVGWYRQGDAHRSWNFGQNVSRGAVGHNGWTGTMILIEPEQNICLAYFTSKRNTPYREKNTYEFDGSYFTAANYGFVPQLIFEGMTNGRQKKQSLLLLLNDMARDKLRLANAERSQGRPVDASHPIVQAAYSLLEVFVRRAKADGSEEALSLARAAIGRLLPTRDAEEILIVKEMLK